MTLKKELDKTKQVNKINLLIWRSLPLIKSFIVLGLYTLILQVLWNFSAPKWNFPQLSYIEFGGQLLFIILSVSLIDVLLGVCKNNG